MPSERQDFAQASVAPGARHWRLDKHSLAPKVSRQRHNFSRQPGFIGQAAFDLPDVGRGAIFTEKYRYLPRTK
ncbi:hypothetical protein [Brenneria izbisi]|uniref:Uncharacterized protein n=1 Tax=Brenneria izbisi TaxID=2939450 RepID=A0AA41Y572_9GAMM|nr:hypothetical protein [Brenneria izbisi]MCV9879601.1 hypothetical protein [Brenneria izbisi]MCV9882990.1 hypothetical protein [Brenneria izbisi]